MPLCFCSPPESYSGTVALSSGAAAVSCTAWQLPFTASNGVKGSRPPYLGHAHVATEHATEQLPPT